MKLVIYFTVLTISAFSLKALAQADYDISVYGTKFKVHELSIKTCITYLDEFDFTKTFIDGDFDGNPLTSLNIDHDIRLTAEKAKFFKTQNYSSLRLALLAQAYANLHGALPNFQAFCKDQKLVENQNRLFANSGLKLLSLVESQRVVQRYSLNEYELSAVRIYIQNTDSLMSNLNRSLWEEFELDQKLSIFKFALDAALEKLPAYTSGPLIRYSDLPDQVLMQHQVKNVITYKGYTSTSKNPNWLWSGKHRFIIYPHKRAIDISSMNSSEDEVLFKRNTQFRIMSRKPWNNGFEFEMEEL